MSVDARRWAERGLAAPTRDGSSILDLLLDARVWPMTLEEAAIFIRAAYGCGYDRALRDEEPLPVEVAERIALELALRVPLG